MANGVVVGAIVAVTAVGLTLVYSILRITNFAHGDLVTLGAYTALTLNLGYGVPPKYGIPLAFLVGGLAAVILELTVWRRMRRTGAGTVALIVASIGLALFLRNALVFHFGNQHRAFEVVVQRAQPVPGLPIMLTPDQKFIALAAFVLVALLHMVLKYTAVGKAMRAMADNLDLAWTCGVDVDRIIMWTWLLAGGLAASGGVLYSMTRPVYPELGWHLLLPMFAAIILGGIGNPYGAVLGGLLIGIAQEMSVIFFRAEYKMAVGFAVMSAVLFLMPRGLLGEEVHR